MKKSPFRSLFLLFSAVILSLSFSSYIFGNNENSSSNIITEEDTLTDEDSSQEEDQTIEQQEQEPKQSANQEDYVLKTPENKKADDANSAEIDRILEELQENSENTQSATKIAPNLIEQPQAKLIILNKITAKSSMETFKIGKAKKFGNVTVEVKKCIQDTNPYKPNNYVLVNVTDQKPGQEKQIVFQGWLISADPSISTVEHAVYEVIPSKCL